VLLEQIALAGALTLATTAIHGACTMVALKATSWLQRERRLVRTMFRKVLAIAALVMLIVVASLVEAWVWSLAYLAVGALEDAERALYFSIVTFTTLGYGDVTLDVGWRLLGAMQASVGIVIFGWSTALVLASLQRLLPAGGEH